MPTRTLLALFVGCVATVGLVACDAVSPGADATPTLVPDVSAAQDDPMVPAVRGRIENRLRIPGLIEAHGQEVLAFDVPGVVASVRAQRGTAVQAGSVLASLDAESLNARIEVDRATQGIVLEELAVAEARLADERSAAERALLAAAAELSGRIYELEVLTTPPSEADVLADKARIVVLEQVAADRRADLTAAGNAVLAVIEVARTERSLRQAELAEAQAALESLPGDATAREIAAAEALVAAASLAVAEAQTREQQATSPEGPPHLRAARRAVAVAEADLLQAQSALERLLARPSPTAVASAEAALASAQHEHDLAAGTLAGLDAGTTAISADAARLRAEVERIDERVATFEDRLTRLDILAPFDGVIARVLTVRGREIAEGEPVIELASTADLVFEAVASPEQAANLSIDQIVTVTVRAFPETPLEGTVVTLPLETGDASDKPFIQLTVDWAGHPVTIGMQGVITVVLGASDGVLKVPATAVWTVNGRSFVETLIDGRRRTRPVTLGMQTEEEVEIVNGLADGDMVFATVRS